MHGNSLFYLYSTSHEWNDAITEVCFVFINLICENAILRKCK